MPAYHQWRSSRRAMIAYCSRSIRAHRVANVVDGLFAELGIQRQAQHLGGEPLRVRQRPHAGAELEIRRLQMRGKWVVNVGTDPPFHQVALQALSLSCFDDK